MAAVWTPEPTVELARRVAHRLGAMGRFSPDRICRALWTPRRDPETGQWPTPFWVCPSGCNEDLSNALIENWRQAGLEVPVT